MTTYKDFLQEIQTRLGDGTTEGEARRAMEWLENFKPIDYDLSVAAYLQSLGDPPDIDLDPCDVLFDLHRQEKANAVWALMVKDVFGLTGFV